MGASSAKSRRGEFEAKAFITSLKWQKRRKGSMNFILIHSFYLLGEEWTLDGGKETSQRPFHYRGSGNRQWTSRHLVLK